MPIGIASICNAAARPQPASRMGKLFPSEPLADNFMMHMLVHDVDAWWATLQASALANNYGVQISPIVRQPWRMRDFVVFDPSGVLWRIGQNDD